MRNAAAFLLLVLATSLAASPLHAQLISPGKLSAAHAELEGMRQCTQCHELGQRGASAQRCLGCHTRAPDRSRTVCPVNPKTGCVGCHMPSDSKSMSHVTFVDHRIRVLPRTGEGRR